MIARRKHDWMRKADPAMRGPVTMTEDDYYSVSTVQNPPFISIRDSRGSEHLMEPGNG